MTDRLGRTVSFFLVFVCLCLLLAMWERPPAFSQIARGDFPGDTLRLSLDQAIKFALENNEDIRIAEAALDKARGRKKEATSAALPYIGLDAGYTRNILRPVIFFRDPIEIGEENDYMMHLSFNQVLFAFGRVGGAIKAADYFLKSNEASLEAANKQIKLETEIAYYETLLAAEVREIAGQSLDAAQKHFDETKRKLRQQMASKFDSIRAEVQVKNREPDVIKSDNAIRLTSLNLKRIIGIDRNTPVILTDSLRFEPQTFSLEDAIDEAYKMRADVRALRLNVSMAEKIYQVTKRSNFPMLELVGNYTVQGQASGKLFPSSDRFAESMGIGLSLSFPIFDGLENRGRVGQTRADHSAAKYALQKTEKAVALRLQELFDQLAAEKENLESQSATVDMAAEAYRLALVRYTNGLSTSLELEDADLALTSARLNYTEAVFRYMVARKSFEYTMGH